MFKDNLSQVSISPKTNNNTSNYIFFYVSHLLLVTSTAAQMWLPFIAIPRFDEVYSAVRKLL